MYSDYKYVLKLKHFLESTQITYYPKKVLSGNCKGKSTKEESERCSLSRTCSLIKDYVLCNEFDFFVTITCKFDFRNNIKYTTDLINKLVKNYSRNAKLKGYDFKYCYVFELTKSGGVHLHGFFKNMYDLYTNEHGYLSSLYFDQIGFQNYEDSKKCNPFYLIKYIEKEPIKELKHKFYHSKNLKRPFIEYLHDDIGEFKNLPFTFGNEFCKMITIES